MYCVVCITLLQICTWLRNSPNFEEAVCFFIAPLWMVLYMVTVLTSSTDDVTGQMIAAPPTCPGDTFTFKCTVVGNMSGLTIWRMNRSNECILIHRTSSPSICGATFTATPGTGYGTNTTSYLSTLSGTADPALNGTLFECFGPDSNVDPGNRIGSSTLQILGLYCEVL